MDLIEIIKRKSSEGGTALFLLLAAVLVFNWPTWAQAVKRVSFLYGKAAVIFSDSAKPGEKDTYLIRLRKEQSCQIDVNWQGTDIENEGETPAGYTIVFPDGEKIVDPEDGYLLAEIAGDYKIIVSPRTTKTNYRYRIVFTRY